MPIIAKKYNYAEKYSFIAKRFNYAELYQLSGHYTFTVLGLEPINYNEKNSRKFKNFDFEHRGVFFP